MSLWSVDIKMTEYQQFICEADYAAREDNVIARSA